MKICHSIFKYLFLLLFAASLWQCNNDPASPSYSMEDIIGHWIINSMQHKGKVIMSVEYSLGLFDTSIDTTINIDTLISLSGDSNYTTFYPDSTYKLSIDSSAYPDYSDMFDDQQMMYKKTFDQMIYANYVKDTGSWFLSGNTLRCSSYTDGHVLQQSISLSENSLTAVQVFDTSITTSEEGYSMNVQGNLKTTSRASKPE